MITRLLRAKDAVSARLSLAGRVAVITTLAMTLTLGSVGAIIYLTVRAEFESSMDQSLHDRASTAVKEGHTDAVVAGIPPSALALADVQAAVISDGMVFAPADDPVNARFAGVLEAEVAAGETSSSARSIEVDGRNYRVVAVNSGPGTALVLAQSMESTRHALERLAFILIFTGIAGVAVAGLTGWAVATRGLQPVRRLRLATEHVAKTEELKPIPVTGSDELARLSASFNAMLRALDASQTRQRQLVADAGHELRTPLTSLRTNIELMEQASQTSGRGLTDEQREDLLTDMDAQVKELTTLVGDLVELARDEPLGSHVEEVDIADLVSSALRRVQLRAPMVTFDVETSPWVIEGESVLLERAVTNLLDNAAKWSPPEGTVTVRLAEGVFVVEDEGPGINEEDLPYVFERFYRSTEARTLPGSGLGLSIVSRAAERHGGSVEAGSSPSGGTRMVLTLPGPHEE